MCDVKHLCVYSSASCMLKWELYAKLTLCFINSRKFQKEHRSLPAVNLSGQQIQTQTQKFISAYNKLREEDKVLEENLYQAATDVMNAAVYSAADAPKAESSSLASSFQEAGRDTGVNIKDIFKD